VAFHRRLRNVHILTTAIEHEAVLNAAAAWPDSVSRSACSRWMVSGRVDPEAVRAALRPATCLISVMHANNETGVLQPIEEIGRIAREAGVPFHIDAVQTAGLVPLDVDRFSLDLASLSAHKLYGPKGVGALYVRRGTRLAPLVDGGSQEGGLRAGTLNVAGIVGMGAAVRLARTERPERVEHARRVRDALAERLVEVLPEARAPAIPPTCSPVIFTS